MATLRSPSSVLARSSPGSLWSAGSGWWRHAAGVIAGFVLLFAWVFAQPLTSGRLLSESDLFDQYLPLFRSPLLVWSSFEFGGVPAFADPENSAFYPVRALFAVAGSWNGFLISAFVLAACFTYAYLYSLTRSRAAAAFGATGFVLSEAMIERVPHANILHAIVWLPLLLLAIDAMRTSRHWMLWVGVAALAGASSILAGHPQFALYIAYVSAAYAVCGLIAERATAGLWARTLSAGVLAAMLSAVLILPLVEFSALTIRQVLEFPDFVDYANTPWQMLSALFPDVTHSGLEAPTYVGLVMLPLAGLAVTRFPSNWRVLFWLVVAAVGLLLGVGESTPVARVLYEIPLFDRFRIASRFLMFAAFAVTVLSAYGLTAILCGEVSLRAVRLAGGALIGIVISAALLLARFPDAIRFDRLNEAFPLPWLPDRIWVQLLTAAVSVVALFVCWRHSQSRFAVCLLITILAGDLLHASSYHLTFRGLTMPTVEPSRTRPGPEAQRIAAALAPGKQRFVSAPDSLRDEVIPGLFVRAWGIPGAGGYTSLLLKDAAELSRMSPNGRVDSSVLSNDDLGLDLLAVKYLIARDGASGAMLDPVRWPSLGRSLGAHDDASADARGEPAYTIFENRHALPRAWLASEILPVTDGAMVDAIRTSRLRSGAIFDPRAIALVFEGEVPAKRFDSGGTARIGSIDDSRITVDVDSPGGGFLVLSEMFYPGWRARIDSQPAQPVHRTDLALQGIEVPAGRHTVVFEFVSRTRRAGLAISGAGLLATIAIAGFGLRRPAGTSVHQ